MAFNLYHTLSKISKIKRKEIILPIARRLVVVSPLSVGDDLVLKTALVSPARLDKEMMRLLWQHTEFWIPNPETQQRITDEPQKPQDPNEIRGIPTPKKRGRKKKEEDSSVSVVDPNQVDNTSGYYKRLSEQEFYNTISYFDKLVLLWGIYATTYETLGTQTIECPHCHNNFQVQIDVNDTWHDDSVTLFEDETTPFSKYSEKITIPYDNDFMLEFTVRIPSMADFNRVLGLVSQEELQSNLQNIKSQFNTEQLICLYTKSLAVYPKDDPSQRAESIISNEILTSVRDFVNIEVGEEFFKQYDEHFGKYAVNFYQNCECPTCKQITKQEVDIEYNFFLRQLPNRT